MFGVLLNRSDMSTIFQVRMASLSWVVRVLIRRVSNAVAVFIDGKSKYLV